MIFNKSCDLFDNSHRRFYRSLCSGLEEMTPNWFEAQLCSFERAFLLGTTYILNFGNLII